MNFADPNFARNGAEGPNRAKPEIVLFVVRLWDMMDGWIDVFGPATKEDCEAHWQEKTGYGTRNTKYSDGDYYAIFPSGTKMVFTPEFLGR